MPPKWTLGFLNSQWGSDEAEIKQLAATYRQKHIPIDAFILDYDWKAWGEDSYGECAGTAPRDREIKRRINSPTAPAGNLQESYGPKA
jgi:hypothetical protein